MDELTTYHKYNTKDERIAAWKAYRAAYDSWRPTTEARKFISWRIKKQQGLCFICLQILGGRVNIDHIFPLYLGGTNAKANLCITHPECNMDKGILVYSTYKQACKRRQQFNLMRKANRAKQKLVNKPGAKLSKKDSRALKQANKLVPIGRKRGSSN